MLCTMTDAQHKETLQRYLDAAWDALLWKLEGLGEYDLRRPLTPTGTNLLGLVKHLALTQAGYFGDTFKRSCGGVAPWGERGEEENSDMWATAEESPADIVALAGRVRQDSAATVALLDLDAPGRVPWWRPERRDTTLQHILVHMIAEAHRHAGHADILRERIDGSAGVRAGATNLPQHDSDWWGEYRIRLEHIARSAGTGENSPD